MKSIPPYMLTHIADSLGFIGLPLPGWGPGSIPRIFANPALVQQGFGKEWDTYCARPGESFH